MNILWLEDFLALASTGSFSRAADARHVTQPAFSRRIRALEDWLGVTLVDREVQPIVLTEAGRWFESVARDLVVRIGRMPDEARAIVDARASTLRFAATHALSLGFLPSWLRRFDRLASPVELTSDVLERCEDAMLERRVQFLLCHAHPDVGGRLDGRCPFAVVGRDVLLPVSAPDDGGRPRHALVGAREAIPLLAFSPGSGMARIVTALRGASLAKAGATPVFTAHLATVLRRMALDGRGVAWLPRTLVDEDLAARRLVAAAPAAWRIEVEIRLYREEARLAPAAESFWDEVIGGRSEDPS